MKTLSETIRTIVWRISGDCVGIGTGLLMLLAGVTPSFGAETTLPAGRPNVIVILTDDQGYGDLSCHGNPILKTPNLDKLHDESIRFTDFHVAPMCTPSRGEIITGIDCLPNAAWIVSGGRSLLRREFPPQGFYLQTNVQTVGDIFLANGYRTGHFGKWHLGDSYPNRSMDRGFEETITFRGYGIGNAQDYWGNSYFNDVYLHNGKPQRYQGYCTDVWFEEATKWIKACAQRKEPFMVYLPLNAAHVPLLVPEKYSAPFKGKVRDDVARFFGMLVNVDENIGKFDAMLKETGLYDNTIVVFLSDNGGTFGVNTWNAGMRGQKCSFYDGGHRVPCFIRWPAGKLRPSGDVAELTECQDLVPTLVELCGLRLPESTRFDGASLAPLLRARPQPELVDRKIVVQYGVWDEYEAPRKWSCCVMWGKWRLVKGLELYKRPGPKGKETNASKEHPDQLYDIAEDPGQEKNVAAEHPDIVAALTGYYEQWWKKAEPLAKEWQGIHLGSEHENPVFLGGEDWAAWDVGTQGNVRKGIQLNGPWHVIVERAGTYEISLRRWPVEADAAIAAGVPAEKKELCFFEQGKALPITKAGLEVAGVRESKPVGKEDKVVVFTVQLPVGKTTLQTWFYDENGKELCGAYYVCVKHIE